MTERRICGYSNFLRPPMPRDDLTLCLSGGGFRAMLFHLGVIRALRDLDFLESVRNIFSVSGGSIAAAHLVLNWERYTATKDAAFQEVANELVEFAGLDLRGKILRRAPLGWIPPFYFARTEQLARGYGKLFKNLMLESLTATGRPRLHILATNMVSGELYFFDAAGIHKIDAAGIVSQVADAAELPIGKAVAASSAFPPFFPPVKLKARELGITDTRMRSVERFTDGGVFDNTGVRAALALAASGRLVVSDASAGFDQATDQAFRIVISRAIRSSDILMSRVSALEDEHLRHINPSFVSCNISEFITKNDLRGINVSGGVQTQSPAVQKWIKNVRTDLDKFPMALIQPIFRHGYETGLRLGPQLSPGRQFVITHPTWSPGGTRSQGAEQVAGGHNEDREHFPPCAYRCCTHRCRCDRATSHPSA